MALNIPIILGTNRPGNKTQHAANFILEVVKKNPEVETFLVKPEDLNIKTDGDDKENKDPKFTKITEEADGFILVTPEYNHSFAPTLKRIMDTELENYKHKAVTVATVSSGPWGGTRAGEHLAPYLRYLGLYYTSGNIYFTQSYETFDDEGNVLIDADKYEETINKQLKELIWIAKALKNAREES